MPEAVGVPLISPVREFSVRPVGKLPDARLHVYGVLPPDAARVCEYDAVTVPSERVAVVTVRVLYIVIESALVSVAPLSSITWTVKLLVPAVVGVPLITPVEAFKLNPAGRTPIVILQLYGVLPPEAVRVWLYTLPTLPSARVAVVTLTLPNIVIASALLAVAPFASVTCTVKLLVPAAVGVPLITPIDVFRLKPAGSVPESIPHVYGVLPPVDANV